MVLNKYRRVKMKESCRSLTVRPPIGELGCGNPKENVGYYWFINS